MKLEGVLYYWNPQRYFGVIEVRVRMGAGWRLDKYFLHSSQIVFQTVEEIRSGCWARFEIRNFETKPGQLPLAGNVEIFENQQQAQQAQGGAL